MFLTYRQAMASLFMSAVGGLRLFFYFIIGLFLIMALIFYNGGDAHWDNSGFSGEVLSGTIDHCSFLDVCQLGISNMMGIWGAHSAGILMHWLGPVAAWAVPGWFMMMAARPWLKNPLRWAFVMVLILTTGGILYSRCVGVDGLQGAVWAMLFWVLSWKGVSMLLVGLWTLAACWIWNPRNSLKMLWKRGLKPRHRPKAKKEKGNGRSILSKAMRALSPAASSMIVSQDSEKPRKEIPHGLFAEFIPPNEQAMAPMLPSIHLLKDYPKGRGSKDLAIDRLQKVLEDFGVKGSVLGGNPGPIVTLYDLEPAAGVKSSRIISLADDVARSMSAVSARVAVIPGKNLIGIELSNTHREMVCLRELLASPVYADFQGALPIALGKDISGTPVVVDLTKMPHVLVAGTTGSGKSVGINSMILSLLYRLRPAQCRLLMIDPKMLELSVYDDIPHLLTPVITDPQKAILALRWVVQEMENRYRLMSRMGVRNISGYNDKLADSKRLGQRPTRAVQVGFDDNLRPMMEEQSLDADPLPFIVVVIDEMADLMLVAGKELETLVQRLAQMARAAGIHLIMATQRPSVDVITGTIKANFPTRISFQVTSKIDSRTILGEQGAEHLLGQGDMLYMASGGRISRIHGPFVSDEEIARVVQFLHQTGAPSYVDLVLRGEDEVGSGLEDGQGDGVSDDLYRKAVDIVRRDGKISISYLQRQLQIGYNRSARLVEQMEKNGFVSPPNHLGKREILG